MRTESVVAPAPLRRSLAVGSLRGVLARHWASILVSTGVVLWGLAFSLLAADRHRTFLSARFDLGNMVQAVWNTAHGRFLETTTADGIQLTRVGVHVDPLLALFAPAWWVWPSPLLLTTVQAFALALGALPVFWLARAHTGDRRIALNLAAAYLLYPAVQWGALNDFHPVTLAIPLLLFMVWALDEERLLLAVVFAVLAALAKEDVPLVIAGIGVWYGVRHSRPRAGALIAGLGIAWTAVALYVVIPHFSGGPSPFYGRFASVGGSPSGVVRTLFEDPGRIWDAATTGADLRYLFILLVPLLALWALEPLLALAALPVLAMNLLSDFWSMHRVEYQYVSAIVACLFAASAIGVGRLSRRAALVWTTAVLALVAVASLSGPLASLDTYGVKARPSPAKVDAERRALALIPGDAAVSSSNALGAHLSARERIYSFPVRDRADWVIVDATDTWLATREKNLPDVYRAQLAAVAADPGWQLVFRQDGVLVYRRAATGDRS